MNAEATLVNADMGLPSRKLLRIQLDFVVKEGGSFMRQGHDSTKTLAIVVVLDASGLGAQTVRRRPARWPNLIRRQRPKLSWPEFTVFKEVIREVRFGKPFLYRLPDLTFLPFRCVRKSSVDLVS